MLAAVVNFFATFTSYVGEHAAPTLHAAEAHLRADAVAAVAQTQLARAQLEQLLLQFRTATMVDMRVTLLVSCACWAGIFTVLWNMPAVARLQSKRTIAELGVSGAMVETCDRITATMHACVATVFGCMAWTYFGTGVCDLSPPHVKVLRVGTAVTAGFIIYDFSVILVADVMRGFRPVAKDMLLHHLVIGCLALYVLTFETMEPMLWFFSVNLFNEISTVFLHLCKFSAECGMKETTLFMALGGLLVSTFFIARVCLISLTLALLGKSHLCGIPTEPAVTASIYTLVAIHWCLNVYWFGKLMAMVLRKKGDSRPNTPRAEPADVAEPAENMPLLDESQTSQGAAD